MDLTTFIAAADALRTEGLAQIASAATADALTGARNALVGRRSGRLTELMKQLGALPADARREAGAAVNRAKAALETALAEREAALAPRSEGSGLDLTMPARRQWKGGRHPVTLVMEEVEAIFRELGFTVALGPEAETEWYNFGSLNFPPDHPAMDAHDTLYLSEGVVLRTHTSPVQVRTLQRWAPPIRVLVPGYVYRMFFLYG